MKPIGGITRKNFEQIASDWVALQKGKGFMIAPKDHTTTRHGYFIKATPMEWGAWRAWRRTKNLPLHFMDRQGYYMVPTQWPHQFDAEISEVEDREAGRKFFDAQL